MTEKTTEVEVDESKLSNEDFILAKQKEAKEIEAARLREIQKESAQTLAVEGIELSATLRNYFDKVKLVSDMDVPVATEVHTRLQEGLAGLTRIVNQLAR